MIKQGNVLPILAGLASSCIFGFTFLFTAQALDEVAPMHLLGYRFLIAALALTVLQLFGVIQINLRGKNLRLLLILAVIEPVAYFIFETIGIQMTSASESGMVVALNPILVTILSALFLREYPTPLQVGSICLSVGGVLFIVWMKSAAQIGFSSFLGMWLLLGSVLMAAMYKIISRKLSTTFNPMEITFVIMWIGAITFNGISLVQHLQAGNVHEYFSLLWNGKVLTSILYLGIVASIGGYFCANYMLGRIDAVRAGVFSNLVTVIAILAGIFIRGDQFYWYQGVGSVLIILGVFGTNYFGTQKKARLLAPGKWTSKPKKRLA